MPQDVQSLSPEIRAAGFTRVGYPPRAQSAPSRWRSATLWLVLGAFLLRIAFMLAIGTYRFDHRDDQSEVNEDTYIARSIVAGHGFSSPFAETYTGPTAWVAPIYPYFIAGVFKLFGSMTQKSYLVIQCAQSLFSALTVVPLIGILTLCGSRRSGIAAGTLWAFFPWFSRWALTWIWETALSAFLVASVLWFALWLADHGSRRAWIAFGAFWGFILLVNPAIGSLLPITLAYALYGNARRGQSWLRPLLTTVGVCVLVISPWLIRNRVAMGQWVFVRDNFGFEFALGNYHLSFGRGWAGKHPAVNPREFDFYQNMGELGYIRANTRQALDFVHQYPGEFLELCAKRVLYFWDGSAMLFRGPVAPYWLPWSFGILSLLLPAALSICWQLQLRGWWILFGTVAIFPIPYYLTYSPILYRHILEPVIVLMISYAAVEGWEQLTSYVHIEETDAVLATKPKAWAASAGK